LPEGEQAFQRAYLWSTESMASVNFSPMSDGSPFPSFQPQLHCTPPIGNYIQHNGLITPLASPIKTDYPEPVGCPPALELNPPEPQPKKRERQTTISEHLKSTKKTSTGNPRGRPRKHPLKEGQLTAAQRVRFGLSNRWLPPLTMC
jgi:hypothetical protein